MRAIVYGAFFSGARTWIASELGVVDFELLPFITDGFIEGLDNALLGVTGRTFSGPRSATTSV
jgi:hypothetical protein